MFKLTLLIILSYQKSSEGFNIGTIATSLLSNGLQPQSQINAGQGTYLRDSFRQSQLIPTFKRIRDNFLQLQEATYGTKVFIAAMGTFIVTGFAVLSVCIFGLRNRVKSLEDRQRA